MPRRDAPGGGAAGGPVPPGRRSAGDAAAGDPGELSSRLDEGPVRAGAAAVVGRGGAVLQREFFCRPATAVAPDLLGCVVRHRSDEGVVAVRLTEVEAYLGEDDPGSHAFRGVTPRTRVMFGPPGHAYVYFSYGMHWCMNLVCDEEGTAAAVLLRAGEVVEGLELAAARRRGAPARDLARGPARLTQALGVNRQHDGVDVLGLGPLQVLAPAAPHVGDIAAGPRTGVGGGGAEQPWRFFIPDDPSVSPYRPHQPRRRGSATRPAGSS